MQTFIQFLESNPEIIKDDDWSNLEDQMNDALFCRNLDDYFRVWLKENGVSLLRDFHNSKSDINFLEDKRQEEYFNDFQEYLEKF